MTLEDCKRWVKTYRQKELQGRYITYDMIAPYLGNLPDNFDVVTLGYSVKGTPIHSVTVGTGPVKILMWSQMHGNESTTTKSIFDLYKFLNSKNVIADDLLRSCTIMSIPMLNPDGAQAWTRENENGVDLNRDAVNLSQPESQILRNAFEAFTPDFCFNLHGQRTIYGFEETGKPSILSFLTPSEDEMRTITLSRKRSMNIISSIHTFISEDLEGCIGRYDDGFNANCTGDSFQSAGVPTILFEAGHYPEDYEREVTREYITIALIKALHNCSADQNATSEHYFKIPEHQKCYCDIRIDDIYLDQGMSSQSLYFQYEEVIENDKIFYKARRLKGVDDILFAHKVIDANGAILDMSCKALINSEMHIANISVNNGFTITL